MPPWRGLILLGSERLPLELYREMLLGSRVLPFRRGREEIDCLGSPYLGPHPNPGQPRTTWYKSIRFRGFASRKTLSSDVTPQIPRDRVEVGTFNISSSLGFCPFPLLLLQLLSGLTQGAPANRSLAAECMSRSLFLGNLPGTGVDVPWLHLHCSEAKPDRSGCLLPPSFSSHHRDSLKFSGKKCNA